LAVTAPEDVVDGDESDGERKNAYSSGVRATSALPGRALESEGEAGELPSCGGDAIGGGAAAEDGGSNVNRSSRSM
jgi:hypothetical protein